MPVKISPGTAEVCTAEDRNADLSYLDPQDDEELDAIHAERKKRLYEDCWYPMGIYARVTIVITQDGANYGVTQEIRSPGLWGTESDSGQDYLDEIANQELDELAGILSELGCDPAEIAASIEEARP